MQPATSTSTSTPTPTSTTEALTTQILAAIHMHKPPLPRPSPAFIRNLVASRATPPPLPSLVATARARILAADLTTSCPGPGPGPGSGSNAITSSSGGGAVIDARWAARSSFPAGAADPLAKETKLPRDVTVQVLDIKDVTASAWETVQLLEAVARGEMRRGREVIRLPVGAGAGGDGEGGEGEGGEGGEEEGGGGASGGNGDATTGATAATAATGASTPAHTRAKSKATHKLTVQDASGTKLFALELVRGDPPRIGIGITQIGEKIVLRAGTVVARGIVLLVPENCHFLGGKVDAWDKAWSASRLETLRKRLEELKQPVIEID